MISVRLLSEIDLEIEIQNNEFNEDVEFFKAERRNTFESVNLNRLGDAIFPYNHETLEGYTMERHKFVWNMDENLKSFKHNDLDDFNRMIIEVAKELYGVEITSL